MNALAKVQNAAMGHPSYYERLLPSQKQTLERLERAVSASPVTFLMGEQGTGKATVLRAFYERHRGYFVGREEVLAAHNRMRAETGNETMSCIIEGAFQNTDLVILDDLRALHLTSERQDERIQYTKWFGLALDRGKRLVAGTPEHYAQYTFNMGVLRGRLSLDVLIDPLQEEDYETFLRAALGNAAGQLNFPVIFRHAPGLNCSQLKHLCLLLGRDRSPTTQSAIAEIDEHIVSSNTRVSEVEALRFDQLPGVGHIASKLETHVILPLENAEVAQQLDLRPKRGVLLYGPPGTGKTSIGRALAHRMKGKFFLIDGTVVTEPPTAFFSKLQQVVADAKKNAPAVLFIDDADVLFGIVHISGFARYLLTLLDGMESQSAGKVCLMMTAMDVGKIPTPVLRSGRVELWLETRLPDLETRASILKKWMGSDLPGHDLVDYQAVAEPAERFTPADLRRVVADAHAFYGQDEILGRPYASAQAYLARAVGELVATRARMAENLNDETLRVGGAPVRAKYGAGIGGLVESSANCAVKGW